MDLLGKISKSIEKFLQKHSSKRTYWKTETWHGSSRQHLTGNGSMDLLKISKFVQLKNWKNSSKRACWKTETFKRDIFFSSFLRILHIYILSPPFFFRPPRRTTRFTDRNEQPAVKVDVHVLLLLLRSSSAFHRPTFDECCRGGKFAARSGKRKRFARAGRECVKREKKEWTDTCPVSCVPETVWKKGEEGGDETRVPWFSSLYPRLLVLLARLSKDILFSRFRGERSSCPRRRKRGGETHESKMSFKNFLNSKVESEIFLGFFTLFIVWRNFEFDREILFSSRGVARRVSSSIFKVSCIHEPFIVEPNNVINLFDLAAVLSRDSTTCWKCYYLLQTITSLPVDNDTKA